MNDSQPELAESFEQVMQQREKEILRAAYRILGNWADAEDVAQEAFIRLHRQWDQIPDKGVLRGWLYRVAVNLCLDRARAAKRFEPLLTEPAPAKASAENEMIREQQREMVTRALAVLPPRERAALVLREIEELSTADVATILGSSEATVRSQVAKGISRLRSVLKGEKA